MTTVFDYIRWRGDLSFEQSSLCEIDALIFCELSYIFFDGIVPENIEDGTITLKEAAETFFERNAGKDIITLGELVPREIVDLLRLAATSVRFSDVEIGNFVNVIDDETVEQFSAVSFYPDDRIFVTYRGTDDSIAGWREDFRMAFLTPVPAQRHAEEYLAKSAENFDGRIVIGGHSKGGNLALWAALNASDEIAERTDQIYNFDGPGFLENVWESENYTRIADKITTVIPSGSVVGLLLKYDANYKVTKSTAKSYLHQHDALTWIVEGRNFVCDADVLPDVKRANEMVGKWIYAMDPEDRRNFVEGFFDILCSTNAKTVTELAENRTAVLKAFSTIDPETKAALMTGVKFFLGEGKSSVSEAIRSLFRKKSEEEEEPASPPKKEEPQKQVRKVPAKKCRRKRKAKMRKHIKK
ncbi:MAG: DUF2974 domain-containing protein [Clostridia bacterium]|nr:DUF2974 domain-containing protein [Clostridia bacterium]